MSTNGSPFRVASLGWRLNSHVANGLRQLRIPVQKKRACSVRVHGCEVKSRPRSSAPVPPCPPETPVRDSQAGPGWALTSSVPFVWERAHQCLVLRREGVQGSLCVHPPWTVEATTASLLCAEGFKQRNKITIFAFWKDPLGSTLKNELKTTL